jgi:septal ring factor EnvC (AmiA/AmiB activator)
LPIKARPSRSAIRGVWLAAVVCGAAIGVSAVASPAAPLARTPAARKAELKEQQGEVRERIEAMRRDLVKSEESQVQATDQLRATESAISDANRKLRQLADQRGDVQAEVKELAAQAQRLAQQTELQQSQLSRLLSRHFTHGARVEMDALHQLLAGGDPNQAALDYYFLTRLSQAKADLIADLRDKARTKKRLTDGARDKSNELAVIEQKQQQARGALLDQQKQRQALLATMADRIRGQRREIGTLRKDEKRLAHLLEGLTRIVKRPPRETARPVPTRPGQAADPARPAPTIQNERSPDPDQAGGAFADLKGRLHLPVRGEVAGRFGKPRPEGGTSWKGLFIRAAEGGDVKAIAAGQVVYADWLRGFGNLLVLDHGDGFLSVYGNNQSLFKETGQSVRPGEVVATVGNSGGNLESGLYFEIRHQGQAFDPLRWVSLR